MAIPALRPPKSIANPQNNVAEPLRRLGSDLSSPQSTIGPLENRNLHGGDNTSKLSRPHSFDLQDMEEPHGQEFKKAFLSLDQRSEHARAARQARTIDSNLAADSAMGLDDEAGPPGVYASSDSPWDRTYAQFLKHGGSWQRTNRPFYASTLSSSSEPSTSH